MRFREYLTHCQLASWYTCRWWISLLQTSWVQRWQGRCDSKWRHTLHCSLVRSPCHHWQYGLDRLRPALDHQVKCAVIPWGNSCLVCTVLMLCSSLAMSALFVSAFLRHLDYKRSEDFLASHFSLLVVQISEADYNRSENEQSIWWDYRSFPPISRL